MRSVQTWAGWLGLTTASALGVFAGQLLGPSYAAPPETKPVSPEVKPVIHETKSEAGERVVAYIHGKIPLTREAYGDYLIARTPYDRLELFVNKCIIEHACQERGITVTNEEIEAVINEDMAKINLSRNDFITQVLKRYNKTFFEWKEDVIKPRLMLTKLYRGQVVVTDEDLQQAFICKYGEKIDCRVILIPSGEDTPQAVMRVWEEVRQNEEAFLRVARKQALAPLAMAEGKINPVSRYMNAENDVLEVECFKLQPGETSRPIQTKQGTFIVRCEKRIPPVEGKTLESVKDELRKEVIDRKLTKGVEEVFKELKQQAAPTFILPKPMSDRELKASVEKEISEGTPKK